VRFSPSAPSETSIPLDTTAFHAYPDCIELVMLSLLKTIKQKEKPMKRNSMRKATRKSLALRKNNKQHKAFRTGIKAGDFLIPEPNDFWNPEELYALSCGSC
jgi:NhaP-type Na+/H+ and K+/H+ antiporter